jgi:rod shape determining protein RodA
MRKYFIKTLITKKISHLHAPLALLVLLTCCYGLWILYAVAGESIHPWAYKQMINILVCLPLVILIIFIDLRNFYKYAWMIYFVILAMLIVVEILGYTAMGATRWMNFGIIKIQPSEPTKLATIIMLARCVHSIEDKNINKIRYLVFLGSIILLPVTLVIKQPDLGTGVIILLIAICMLFASGVSVWKFIISGLSIIASWPILWTFLRDYQKKRIMVFLNPELDPRGSGYNIIQSKIAIGSGGVWGKGLGEGTQSQLSFLPEHQTDFIFAALAEEFGFIGSLLLIILYGLIIYLSTVVAINAKSVFGKLVVIGVISMFCSHIFINIAMAMGLVPAVGVPLPFVSYGGTMMGSMLGGFGLVLNVHLNQSVDIKRYSW